MTKHLIFAEFICNDNAQCNGHGDCNDEQCDCDSDWSSQVDCSGNISSPSFNMYVSSHLKGIFISNQSFCNLGMFNDYVDKRRWVCGPKFLEFFGCDLFMIKMFGQYL